MRRDEQVNVIGHDHESMQLAAAESSLAVAQSADHHFGYVGLAKEHGAALGVVQQSIHNNERFTRRQVCRTEHAVLRKTSVQAESHENSLTCDIPVWEASLIPIHLIRSSGTSAIVSADFVKAPRRAEARRQARRPAPL
jgi:hypothetical protein